MALSNFPPDWYTNIVSQESWDDNPASHFARQLIPLMDVYQWVYSFLGDIIKIIPHQPPEFRRTVLGQIKALHSGFVPVPLGQVGYNALTKEVIWAVNDQGGYRAQELKIPVQSVLPIVFQLLMMIPWDFFGEVDSAIGGNDGVPKTGDMGKWCYDKVREGLKSAGINLPAVPGGGSDGSNSSSFEVTVPAGTYNVRSGNVDYIFVVRSDTNIKAGKQAGPYRLVGQNAGLDNGIGQMGNTMKTDFGDIRNGDFLEILVSSNVPVPERGNPGSPGYQPAVPGSTIMGKNVVQAEPAVRWIRLTNNTAGPVDILAGTYTYRDSPYEYTYTTPVTITVAANGTLGIRLVGVNPGKDRSWRTGGPAWINSFNPLLGVVPSAFTGTFYQDPRVNGVYDAKPGVDYYGGSIGSTDIVLKNTKPESMQLLPSIADFIMHNIPVMDLSQRLYELLRECVDVITHHPPSFSKPVYAGGVYVQYRYELSDPGDPDTVSVYSFLPTADLLRGKQLEVKALFYDDKNKSLPVLAQGDKPEVTLIKYTFPGTEGVLTFTQKGDEGTWDDDPGIVAGKFVSVPADLESKFPHAVCTLLITEIIQKGQPHKDPVDAVEPDENGENGVEAEPGQEGLPCIFKALLTVRPNAYDEEEVEIQSAALTVDTVIMKTVFSCDVAAKEAKKIETIAEKNVAAGSLQCVITEIKNIGEDPPDDADKQLGGLEGSKAVFTVAYYNKTADPITVTREDLLQPVTFGGMEFIPAIPEDANFPMTFAGKDEIKEYETDQKTMLFTNKPVAQADIAFSATLTPMLFDLCRWMEQKQMEYIGEELSISSPVSGQPVDTLNRILAARLRFKKQMGPGRIERNWNMLYTGKNGDQAPAAQSTPHGSVHIATIEYNALKRSVTIHDAQTNAQVEMRSNACIWFMLQLLILVPITVF